MGGVVDSLGGFLGMSSGPKVGVQGDNMALSRLNSDISLGNSNRFQDPLRDYLSGKINPEDFLAQGGGDSTAWNSLIAQDPFAGSKMATDQVMSNPMFAGMFGNDGALGNALAEDKRLSEQGFKLQPEDHEAYGQISGDIARQFGQSENELAQALASRGLASAPSGAAGMQFSGLLGNKNEQLARAQMQVADKRMQNTMQRRAQAQQYISSLGNQGANAINQQFGRQMAGASERNDMLSKTALLQNQANAGANASNLAASEFEAKNKPKNFMDFATAGVGQGLQSGISSGISGSMGGMGGGGYQQVGSSQISNGRGGWTSY